MKMKEFWDFKMWLFKNKPVNGYINKEQYAEMIKELRDKFLFGKIPICK